MRIGTKNGGYHVRWMVRSELDDVMEIESDSYETPWTKDDFLKFLRKSSTVPMVAEGRSSEPIGFIFYSLHKRVMHIQNIAVAPDYRRLGVGESMIQRLQLKLSPEGKRKIQVEVADFNLGAQLFFKAMGFSAVSILNSYYSNPVADAYRMECSCDPLGRERVIPENRIARFGHG